MDSGLLLQWLPGVLFVALVAFPALFFMRRAFAVRAVVAIALVLAALSLFGVLLGHQFAFTRPADMPPLVLGLVLAWLLAAVGRRLRSGWKQRQGS